MITKALPHTQAAFDEESYEWMEANAPIQLKGIVEDINLHNATPDTIRKFISNMYGREPIALRAEQAARHYLATRNGQ